MSSMFVNHSNEEKESVLSELKEGTEINCVTLSEADVIFQGGARTKISQFKSIETSKPVLTIVTVVYNGSEYIEGTILSVLNQSYSNVEYIIIDGGSTDGTVDIIKRYEARISYWVSEPDKGIYDAMNKAIDVASGHWINFLNAGDVFHSNNVLHHIASQISDSVTVIYGDSTVTDGNRLFEVKSKHMSFWNLIFWSTRTVCHQAMFVKRDACVHYNTKYVLKAELDWYFELLERGARVKYASIPVCVYALGGLSDRLFKLEMTETIKVMFSRYPFSTVLHLPLFIYKFIRRNFW